VPIYRVEQANKLSCCLSFYALSLLCSFCFYPSHFFALIVLRLPTFPMLFVMARVKYTMISCQFEDEATLEVVMPSLTVMLRRSVHLLIGMPRKMSLSRVGGIV
jgi:hypothetical protein